MNNENQLNEANAIIDKIIKILDVKARTGCNDKSASWVGLQNGNGTEIGLDIENLIKKAKNYTKKYKDE